jgi:rRNA maturation RNase YbeY
VGDDIAVEVVVERPLPALGSAERLERLVRHALQAESVSGRWDVTVACVSDSELQRLHRDFMGTDEPTDVMTFPLGDGQQGGDIVVSVDRAVEQGREHGLSAWEEVCFLTVHGVLHLCGWTDDTEELRQRMLDRQSELLATWSSGEAI